MFTEEKTIVRRFLENLDWMLLAALAFLICVGMLSISSATLHFGNSGKFVFTQSAAVFMGLAGMLILIGFNYQIYRQLMYPLYAFSLLMLIAVLVGGKTVHGTKGWFDLGVFAFQPVEIAKLIFILVLAGYLDSRWRESKRIMTLVVSLVLLGGQLMLIMMQPDFGSTLAYFPVALGLLFVAGVRPVYLIGIILFGALAAGIPLLSTFLRLQPELLANSEVLRFLLSATKPGFNFMIMLVGLIVLIFVLWWLLTQLRFSIPLIYPVLLSLIIVCGAVSSVGVQKSLKDYQRKRLIVFLNPDIDPLGSAYNIIQSKIAIGSGRLVGKGLFSGTQSQLGFLPEQHTDFIFSVVGEETGFFVSELTILAYLLLVWRAMVVARESRDRYGSLVATGIATMFAFYSVINIGMVMGMMPATGLPLPFLSYGGSNMVTSLWAVGILLSIHVRRFTN